MVFTVYSDMFEKLTSDEDSIYIRDLINVFGVSTNPFKIAKDEKGIVIDLYTSFNTKYREFVVVLLEMIAKHPSGFETIDVDLEGIECNESLFLSLCAATNGSRQMIAYTKQSFRTFLITENHIDFDGGLVRILDRDEARVVLNNIGQGDIIVDSVVAKGGSKIKKTKNNGG